MRRERGDAVVSNPRKARDADGRRPPPRPGLECDFDQVAAETVERVVAEAARRQVLRADAGIVRGAAKILPKRSVALKNAARRSGNTCDADTSDESRFDAALAGPNEGPHIFAVWRNAFARGPRWG